MPERSFRPVVMLAMAATAACADAIPTSPGAPDATRDLRSIGAVGTVNLTATKVIGDEAVVVSPALDGLNARLAAAAAPMRVVKAELLLDARRWDRHKAVVILAKDFERGIGAEWVPRDPRRGRRRGVTWAFGSNLSSAPYVFTDDQTGFRPLSSTEQVKQIQKGMDAWRDLRCSNDPIHRVPVPPGVDPDFLNDIVFSGAPSPTYAQPADIVHSGWQPLAFFQAIAGPDAAAILGVTFTFVFVDDAGVPTDIDENGEDDLALAEVYYSDIFVWSNRGKPAGTLDFFSIIAHESGHALGLGHWGLIFVREEDAGDGITPDEIRFLPKAMMNALYVGGRNEIELPDRFNFCRIWAGSSRR